MSQRLLFFSHMRLWPCDGGRARATYDILQELVRCGRFDIAVVTFDFGDDAHAKKMSELGAKYVTIQRIGRWNFWNVLQRITDKLGFGCLTGFFIGYYYRKQILPLIFENDVFVINGTMWFTLLPRKFRRKSAIITYDLLYQRKASELRNANGEPSRGRRVLAAIDRWLEVQALKTAAKSVILAEYEEKMLLAAGMRPDELIRIGMPIRVNPVYRKPEDKPKYDFLFLGTNVKANVEGVDLFFKRVMPLLAGRHVSIAVAGSLGRNAVWEKYRTDADIDLLGFVDDLDALMTNVCIGVGCVPWGSGVKVKVVEMMMHHLPVVVTDCGAEGIPMEGAGFVNIDRVESSCVKDKLIRWLDKPESATVDGMESGEIVRTAFSPLTTMAPLVEFLKG